MRRKYLHNDMHQSCWIDSINRQIELQVTVAPEINTYIDGVYNVVKTKHFTQNMIELRLAQSTLKTKNTIIPGWYSSFNIFCMQRKYVLTRSTLTNKYVPIETNMSQDSIIAIK